MRTILATALVLSIASPVQGHDCQCDDKDNKKNLFITAYYSPLPNQEHYALGSYELDVMFIGQA